MTSRVFTGLMIVIACSGTSQAAIFGEDDRIAADNELGSRYSPIGIVYSKQARQYSTGFLVDNCHVLSVRHIFDEESYVEGKVLSFSVGRRTVRGEWTSKGTVVASGGFREQSQSRGGDWILLRLNNCLGERFGYLNLDSAPISPQIDKQQFESAGFPNDKSLTRGITLDPSCYVRAQGANEILHDCASKPGNSGSPIFQEAMVDGKLRLDVFAMHTAGVPVKGVRQFSLAYAGIAIPMRSLVPQISKYLRVQN